MADSECAPQSRPRELVVRGSGSLMISRPLHNDGPETKIGYRLAWARTYLKGMGQPWLWRSSRAGAATDPPSSCSVDRRRSLMVLAVVQCPRQCRTFPPTAACECITQIRCEGAPLAAR
jgi:hypothetical protein